MYCILWAKKDPLIFFLPCSIVNSEPVVASFIQSTLDFPQRCLFIAAAISFFLSRTRDLPNHEFRKEKEKLSTEFPSAHSCFKGIQKEEIAISRTFFFCAKGGGRGRGRRWQLPISARRGLLLLKRKVWDSTNEIRKQKHIFYISIVWKKNINTLTGKNGNWKVVRIFLSTFAKVAIRPSGSRLFLFATFIFPSAAAAKLSQQWENLFLREREGSLRSFFVWQPSEASSFQTKKIVSMPLLNFQSDISIRSGLCA